MKVQLEFERQLEAKLELEMVKLRLKILDMIEDRLYKMKELLIKK